MAELRPGTPDGSSFASGSAVAAAVSTSSPSGAGGIQLQGFPSRGSTYGYSYSRPFQDGDGLASLHSEPDMDTIMPLPGQLQNVVSPGASADEYGSLSSDSEEGEGEVPRRPLLERGSSDFSAIEVQPHEITGEDATALALETCKRTVLRPYLAFLKVIGWRRCGWCMNYDLEPPCWQRVMNVVWPVFICVLLVASCATQIVICFRRDTVQLHRVKKDSDNSSYYSITCERHILTTFIIPDLMLVSAFIYALYIFRRLQTEHLYRLTEAVFLGRITRYGAYSHKKLTLTLQLLMVVGFAWIVYSLGASVYRINSLHLLDTDTAIQWIPSDQKDGIRSSLATRWVLSIVTLMGFVVLDFAYIGVVINYGMQCQLLVYLLHNICDHMKTKEWEIEQSIKEIKNAREFLSQLNSHLARAVSVLLFIFLTSSVQALYGLQKIHAGQRNFVQAAIVGALSAIQWTSILILPLLQASRLTRACSKLKKVSLELRARPYSYKDTPQLDLDSLVTYTSGLSMSAKLVSIPVYPAVVVGAIFTAGFALFLVFQYDNYSWAKWL